MKKITALLLTGTIFASSAVGALASQEVIEVYLNNAKIEFDTDPEIVNDRTFVPLRAIVESFDAEVQWDGETQSITITKDGVSNYLKIGDVNVSTDSNGKTETAVLEAAPYIKDERTMVPLRYISEGFNMQVDWDGENGAIYISENSGVDIVEIPADSEKLEYYGGFSYIPDFGAYFGIAASEQSTDEMYFYENVTEEQKLIYTALLLSLGFALDDEMANDFITSYGFEKENEQLVTASFDNVFGITLIHKRAEFTGEITYYEAHQLVPDYGSINGLERAGTLINDDGTMTYTYKSASGTERAGQMLTYIDVLEDKGYTVTDQTMTTLTMTNETTHSYVIIDQGTDDTVTVRITAK